MNEKPDLLHNFIIMSDEAYFHLIGFINKQKFRYWCPKQALKLHEKPLHAYWARIFRREQSVENTELD